MRYIKIFETHAEYEAYINDNPLLPNLSFCKDVEDGHYNPFKMQVVAKYNVTNTSSPTRILYSSSIVTDQFQEIEIDGIKQPSVVSSYQFDTAGEHTIKFTLVNPTYIETYTFNGISTLIECIIPESVKTTGNYVFQSASSLAKVTLPSNLLQIGERMFNQNVITSVGVKGSEADIEIPDSLTSIPYGAFESCYSLTSVTLPNNITSIGADAFSYDRYITTFNMGNGVTFIGNYAFGGCRGLSSITIPSSVTTIDANAFGGTELKKVITSDINSWCRINFGDRYANPLNSAKYLYSDENTEITTVVIPNDVEEIKYTFYNCQGLTNVSIPNSVTLISDYAFYSCSNLTSITIYATTPPTLSDARAFTYTNDCPIYVPSASVTAYQTATNWSNLASRIQAIP